MQPCCSFSLDVEEGKECWSDLFVNGRIGIFMIKRRRRSETADCQRCLVGLPLPLFVHFISNDCAHGHHSSLYLPLGFFAFKQSITRSIKPKSCFRRIQWMKPSSIMRAGGSWAHARWHQPSDLLVVRVFCWCQLMTLRVERQHEWGNPEVCKSSVNHWQTHRKR